MDDFLEWLRDNLRIVIFAVVAVVVFSVFIGALIGVLKRSSAVKRSKSEKYIEQMYSELEEAKKAEREAMEKEAGGIQFLIPERIDVDPFYNNKDINDPVIHGILNYAKLKNLKVSDLINSLSPDIQTRIRPVAINNEEHEVVLDLNGPFEP